MSFAEIDRYIESQKRIKERADKEKASFDYILADLIGRSIARVYNSSNKMPTIAEAYPSIFTAEEVEEKQQEKKQELSVLRFKQFAQLHNTKYSEVAKNINE
jgi:hypothetical protein